MKYNIFESTIIFSPSVVHKEMSYQNYICMNTGVQQFIPVSILTHSHFQSYSILSVQLLLILVKWVVLLILLHVPPQRFPLLVQVGRHLQVDIGKQQFRIGLQAFFCLLKRLHHRLAGLLPPAPLVVLAPPVTGRHVMSQS